MKFKVIEIATGKDVTHDGKYFVHMYPGDYPHDLRDAEWVLLPDGSLGIYFEHYEDGNSLSDSYHPWCNYSNSTKLTLLHKVEFFE
jgi:hypothetical protein